jgi:molecular chaperone IbpA
MGPRPPRISVLAKINLGASRKRSSPAAHPAPKIFAGPYLPLLKSAEPSLIFWASCDGAASGALGPEEWAALAMVPGVSRTLLLYGGSAMRTYDLTPLCSTVGFDRPFNLLEDSSRWSGEEHNHPPYNIERTGDDQYQIALAMAGFAAEDITITAEQNVLTVEGRKVEKVEHQYLYQGISGRPFRRIFNLADHVQVTSATFQNGLLKIDLVREVPEAMKPRRIDISTTNSSQKIEQKKAA